jgi:hypothetical protein
VKRTRFAALLFVQALLLSACRDDAGYPQNWPALSTKSWVGGIGTGCPNLSGDFALTDVRLFEWMFDQRPARFRFSHTMKILPSVHANAVQFEFTPNDAGLEQMRNEARQEAALPKMTFVELARLEAEDFQCEHGFLNLRAPSDLSLGLAKAIDGALVLRLDAPKSLRSALKMADGFALDADQERHWIKINATKFNAKNAASGRLERIDALLWNFGPDTLCISVTEPSNERSKNCGAGVQAIPFATGANPPDTAAYVWTQGNPEQAALQMF